MLKKRVKVSETENEWSWCPICKHWVPTKYFISEWDPTDQVLTRMCNNCAHDLGDEDLPTFEHKSFRYDPTHGIPKCPYCGQKNTNTRELDCRAKPGSPQYRMWHCGNPSCNKQFKYIY